MPSRSPSRSLTRRLAALPLSLLILAGCQPAPLAPPTVPAASEAPVMPAGDVPSAAPVAPRLVGRAELPTGPFAGATVQAFRLHETTVLATAPTDAEGRFGLALGAEVADGTPVRLVVSQGKQTLVTLAVVGGTPAAYRTAAGEPEWVATVASTLATLAMNAYWPTAGKAIHLEGALNAKAVESLMAAFRTLSAGARDTLAQATAAQVTAAVLGAFDAQGQVALAPADQRMLDNLGAPELRQAFQLATTQLQTMIAEGVKSGALPSTTSSLGLSFGSPNAGRGSGGGSSSRPSTPVAVRPGFALTGNLSRPSQGGEVPAQSEFMTLRSDDFEAGGMLPESYGMPYHHNRVAEILGLGDLRDADGMPEDYYTGLKAPSLIWEGAPAETVSFVVMLEDMDDYRFASRHRPVHWLLYNIPGDTQGIIDNIYPDGTAPGLSTVKEYGWSPIKFENEWAGTHAMRFSVYALSTTLDLDWGATPAEVRNAMQGKILKVGTLDATCEIPEPPTGEWGAFLLWSEYFFVDEEEEPVDEEL